MMLAMQKGHDNSGFAMVMQDLGGAFQIQDDFHCFRWRAPRSAWSAPKRSSRDLGFTPKFDYQPDVVNPPGLEFRRMPHYVFRNYRYPEALERPSAQPTPEQKKLLVETRLKIRQALAEDQSGLCLFLLARRADAERDRRPARHWHVLPIVERTTGCKARVISAQCRQNTNYQIVRYAAHPFFLEGYTLMGNGENTFYQKNKEFQQQLHPAYVGF